MQARQAQPSETAGTESIGAATTDAAIGFAHVTVVHAGRRILDDVSFMVRRGCTVALTGPLGAGKSTAIETALGLHHPEGGVVRLLGLDPKAAVASGRVGVALGSSGFPDGARVRDLLRFAADMRESPLPIVDIVDRTGLGGLLDRSADRLTPGQAQQLRLALAVAGDPDVILLDEPFAGLDAEALAILQANLTRFREEGRTVLFAAERIDSAAPVVDRVLRMDHGRPHDDAPHDDAPHDDAPQAGTQHDGRSRDDAPAGTGTSPMGTPPMGSLR